MLGEVNGLNPGRRDINILEVDVNSFKKKKKKQEEGTDLMDSKVSLVSKMVQM